MSGVCNAVFGLATFSARIVIYLNLIRHVAPYHNYN